MLVRASIGTLAALKILNIWLNVKPTTAYLLQYDPLGCRAKCKFCPQSKHNLGDLEFLSRVKWPLIDLTEIVSKLHVFKRVCFQTILKPYFIRELVEVVKLLASFKRANISISSTPIPLNVLRELKGLGVEYFGIGLDAASPIVFKNVGKPYTWNIYWSFLRKAVNVMGMRSVSVHLIVGLGESEIELLKTIKQVYKVGASVALFAFTPVKGTQLQHAKQPNITTYRVFQIVRYLLDRGENIDDYTVIKGGKVFLKDTVLELKEIREAFLTSGCPYCNRPYYNEHPLGIMYNYPSRELLNKRLERVLEDIRPRLI